MCGGKTYENKRVSKEKVHVKHFCLKRKLPAAAAT